MKNSGSYALHFAPRVYYSFTILINETAAQRADMTFLSEADFNRLQH